MKIKRKHIIIVAVLLLAVIAVSTLTVALTSQKATKYYEVKKGKFEAVLDCKGEISGLHATEVRASKIFQQRDVGLYEMKVTDLIQDGKMVKKGDFVIQLDASQVMSRMRDAQQKLETATADLNNAKIDSAVTLSKKREDITNALLDLEYNKIDLDQSIYESAAYQRRAQMTYEKAQNNITKLKRDYQMEQNKSKAHVLRFEDQVHLWQGRIDKFKQAMVACRVTAPADGIIIFGSTLEGKKIAKDETVIIYDGYPPIGTLPDMSQVISETYVKEIDIAKIKIGDSVRVTFDALNGVTIIGNIKHIAQMGEEHKDFDMKVFKVIVSLNHSDEGLKPAMSSNNEIILENDNNVISVPLSTVFRDENGNKYVYMKNGEGIVKQIIKTGLENDESVHVEEGLSEGDVILLDPPENNPELAEN